MYGNQYSHYGGYNDYGYQYEETDRAEQSFTWNPQNCNPSPWNNYYPQQPNWNYQHEDQYTPSQSYNPHNFWQNQDQHLLQAQQNFCEPQPAYQQENLKDQLENLQRKFEEV